MTLLQIATRHQRLLLRHCDWNLSVNRIVAVHCFSTSTSTPSHSKVVSSAKEALAKLPSLKGITIAVGGFGLGGKPETLLDELCNDDSVSDLTIATLTGGVPGHGLGKLIEDGKVKRLISSYVGENPILEHAFFSGTIQVELTPQGTLAQRLFSAGAGIPAFYTPTGAGTIYANGGIPIQFKSDGSREVAVHSEPKETRTFGGIEYVLEHALPADVALVKAHKADTRGNLVFRGRREMQTPMRPWLPKLRLPKSNTLWRLEVDPNEVHLPGIYVTMVIAADVNEKHIERLRVGIQRKVALLREVAVASCDERPRSSKMACTLT
ncbi:hypothetical protein MHU86_4673 [Fragilaria crotonensis]|nr:hypothetical protein MHU86_4673 [Fragilaria crotonensis]